MLVNGGFIYIDIRWRLCIEMWLVEVCRQSWVQVCRIWQY